MSARPVAQVHWVIIPDVPAFAARNRRIWSQVCNWCSTGWPVHIVTANSTGALLLLSEFQRRGHVRIWNLTEKFHAIGRPIALRIDTRSQHSDLLVPKSGWFCVQRSVGETDVIRALVREITES